MKYIKEERLADFPFWSGALQTVCHIMDNEFDLIEAYLNECNEGQIMTDTEINDFFWFEKNTIAQILDYANFDELLKREEPSEGTILDDDVEDDEF